MLSSNLCGNTRDASRKILASSGEFVMPSSRRQCKALKLRNWSRKAISFFCRRSEQSACRKVKITVLLNALLSRYMLFVNIQWMLLVWNLYKDHFRNG